MAAWKTTEFASDHVKLVTWNVNGLNAVMGRKDLQKFLKEEDPDVLCLNETKMDEKKLVANKVKEDLLPEKYLHFWNCCKSSSGYAGTAIFSKVKPIDVKFDIGVVEHDLEGRTTTLEFEKFIIVACYVPNAGQKLDRLAYRTKKWDPDFKTYLKSLETTKHKCVILCGDLNVAHQEIDISNPKGNLRSAGFTLEERAEFTNLLNAGFVDSFRKLHPSEAKYSYWNLRSGARATNKGWRLDYFVVTDSLMDAVEESDMLSSVMGSDHCPIKLVITLSKVKAPAGGAAVEKVKAETEKKEEVVATETKTKKTSVKKASTSKIEKKSQEKSAKKEKKSPSSGKKSSAKKGSAKKH